MPEDPSCSQCIARKALRKSLRPIQAEISKHDIEARLWQVEERRTDEMRQHAIDAERLRKSTEKLCKAYERRFPENCSHFPTAEEIKNN